MNIKPQDRTIKELLGASFFAIPRFQRPYSWTAEHVEDFWRDVDEEKPDYFIGSCVFYTEKTTTDTMFVVDGQQRLTTITITLCLIRDAYTSINANAQATGLNQYIVRRNVDNVEQTVLSPAASKNWFLTNVQLAPPGATEPANAEEDLLRVARDYARAKVKSLIATLSPGDARKALDRFRDKLLGLRLITISLDNQDDAYVTFETLNTRGEELRLVDMVKNHVMRVWTKKTAPVDEAQDSWNRIRDNLEALDLDDGKSSSRFIHYAWLSRNEYITEKGLYREIRKRVDVNSVKDYMASLAGDSELYAQIMNPTGVAWPKLEKDIGESLRVIKSFKVAQSIPLLLSLLRVRKNHTLKLSTLRSAVIQIRDFHFQYSAIAQKRTGGGTAFMFSSLAREVASAINLQKVNQVISGMVAKLRSKQPLPDEFNTQFVQIRYDHDAGRQIIRFALQAADAVRRKAAGMGPANYDLYDIEHIASQSGAGHSHRDDLVHSVGNLILVTRELNETLGEEAPMDKLTMLRAEVANLPLDPTLQTATAWDMATIESRAKSLAAEVRAATLI